MTITYPSIYPTCSHIRFTLGVPLEDIFPYGDIHPSLNKLLVETFNALCLTTLPLKYVLRYDTPWPDNIFLEKALLQCDPIDYMHPGTLLWMLRHFLGSLPLPVLPKYTDGKCFVWLKISDRCRYALVKYVEEKRANEYLIDFLTDELLRLPSVNLLLVGYLINFMRSLIVYPGKKMDLNKKSTLALAKYFTASIFIRPYRKTHKVKDEQLYRPLVFYLLIKWPEIQLKCMDKHPQCFVPIAKRVCNPRAIITPQKESSYTQTYHQMETIAENLDEDKTNDFHHDALPNDYSCQVHRSESSISDSTDSFVTLPDSDFLKDVSCQTDNVQLQRCSSTQTSLVGLTKKNITKEYPYEFINFDLLNGTYHRYGDYNINYPKQLGNKNGDSDDFICSEEYIYDDYEDAKIATPTVDTQRLSTNSESIPDELDSSLNSKRSNKGGLLGRIGRNVFLSKSNSAREKPQPDSQTKVDANVTTNKINSLLNEGDESSNDSKGSVVSPVSDGENEPTSPICENKSVIDLTVRCSKIGWTYTPENIADADKSVGDGNNYNIYCEKDEEMDLMNIPSSNNVNNNDFHQITNAQTPLHARSKKSLINFNKIRNKIDFLKIFKDRKIEGSASAEHIRSNVKYQKINAAKSTTF